jgi:hypothetical protein
MIALTVALLAASLALFGNILFGLWNRFNERRSIAAALAGEIGAYIKLLDSPVSVQSYRKLAETDSEVRVRLLRAFPKVPSGHPVFDKVADKIGLLPAEDALDVSAIYNVVSGMRLLIVNLSSEQFATADAAMQSAMLITIADSIEKYSQSSELLVQRLIIISRERFSRFLRTAGIFPF